MLQTVDFFYPLIDNPYLMGKITCANVLSDLYSCGVTEVDRLDMMTSECDNMTKEEREIVMPLIMRGFQDNAKSVGVNVRFLTPVINPWCIIGGIATSICLENEYINPLHAQIGDVLLLTKPLGAQIACNTHRWLENPERKEKIIKVISEAEVNTAFTHAILSMSRLNKLAAVLMQKYNAHAATDVTGFGILGHAQNLAQYQANTVTFVLNVLPVIKNVLAMAEVMGSKAKFLKGLTPETSGGLLVALPQAAAEEFCKEIAETERWKAWIVGKVERGDRTARMAEDVEVVESCEFPS